MYTCLLYILLTFVGGNPTYGKETLESLNASGVIVLEQTTVTTSTEINGTLEATGATFDTLTVNGTCKLTDCKITGKTLINGLLEADKTVFEDEISIASNKIVLNNCQVKNILVRKSAETDQVVQLRGKTEVDGDIQFESGQGGLITDPAVTLKGKILGGEIR